MTVFSSFAILVLVFLRKEEFSEVFHDFDVYGNWNNIYVFLICEVCVRQNPCFTSTARGFCQNFKSAVTKTCKTFVAKNLLWEKNPTYNHICYQSLINKKNPECIPNDKRKGSLVS